MAKAQKADADRLGKRRAKQLAKRDRTGDTPQAASEREKGSKQYDSDRLRQLGERTGVYI